MKEIKQATLEVFKVSKYRVLAAAIALAMLALYILLPVATIPGNDIPLQLSILEPLGIIAMVLLSASIGILISMQVYSYKMAKHNVALNAGQGAATGLTSVVSAVFSTASCTGCIAAIFPFLSSGAILFLAERQWYVVGITFVLVIFSLYLTSKKVANDCKSCKVL